MPSRPWSQNATNHKMRRQGFLNCRNLWLSHFVMVQNATSHIHVCSSKGYTLQCRKHVHIDIGHYQEGFLCTLIMGFITDIHTHNRYNNEITPKWAKMQLLIIMSKVKMGTFPSTQTCFIFFMIFYVVPEMQWYNKHYPVAPYFKWHHILTQILVNRDPDCGFLRGSTKSNP